MQIRIFDPNKARAEKLHQHLSLDGRVICQLDPNFFRKELEAIKEKPGSVDVVVVGQNAMLDQFLTLRHPKIKVPMLVCTDPASYIPARHFEIVANMDYPPAVTNTLELDKLEEALLRTQYLVQPGLSFKKQGRWAFLMDRIPVRYRMIRQVLEQKYDAIYTPKGSREEVTYTELMGDILDVMFIGETPLLDDFLRVHIKCNIPAVIMLDPHSQVPATLFQRVANWEYKPVAYSALRGARETDKYIQGARNKLVLSRI